VDKTEFLAAMKFVHKKLRNMSYADVHDWWKVLCVWQEIPVQYGGGYRVPSKSNLFF
jgi:hypothetical protein